MRRDARPPWLLRRNARLSSLRRQRHEGPLPNADTWWQQIVALAAEHQLNPGTPEDWQPELQEEPELL